MKILSRLKLFLLVFVVWLGIPGCLNCPTTWEIDSVELSFWDLEMGVNFQGGEVFTDSLALGLDILFVYGYAMMNDLGSTNSLYAWSCPQVVLAQTVQSIEITSNNQFLNVDAGMPINEYLRYNSYGEFITVDSMIIAYLQEGLESNFWIPILHFVAKPLEDEHIFQVEIITTDGDIYGAKSDTIYWK